MPDRFYLMPDAETGGPVFEVRVSDGQVESMHVFALMRADPHDDVARAIVKRVMRR